MSEKPASKQLDFSLFHPLDHWIWERRCREFYGGWQRHTYLWWTYVASPVIGWWGRWPYYFVMCRFNHHSAETWWSRKHGYRTYCRYCGVRRETLDSEKFDHPGMHNG